MMLQQTSLANQITGGGEDMALLRFASNSFMTAIELDGKGIGEGITKMEFKCAGGEPAKLNLEINLDRFRFLQAGEFDKAVKEMEDMDKEGK